MELSQNERMLDGSKGHPCSLVLSWQPPEPVSRRNVLVSFFAQNGNTFCNVGTIGHVDWGMSPLTAAVLYNLPAARHKLKRGRDWLMPDHVPYYTQAPDF